MTAGGGSRFQRWLLPAFAFKAVVIGGGYATGRELAEFFLPSGPWGGLLGMAFAGAVWSLVAAVTFLFARAVGAFDYRSFFKALLGRFAIAFEAAYFAILFLILAVFGAAAGAIGTTLFAWPAWIGTVALALAIATVVAAGNRAVERLFKWVSIFLYATYAVFLALCLWRFGDRIAAGFSAPVPIGRDWPFGSITYAGYNIIGAVVILPVTRHLTSAKDAVLAGLLCGPLAMVPAILFFVCMVADYPAIGQATLPSDLLLRELRLPVFHVIFQLMIFGALLESGAGLVHAVNERVSAAWEVRKGGELCRGGRLGIASALLVGSMLLAGRFGLIALIAKGYGALAWVFIAVYVAPLLTLGVWRLWRRRATSFLDPPLAEPAR